jgi:hypothetical protein
MAENVKVSIAKDNTHLVLDIDLTHEIGPSASGKAVLIGNSGGYAKIPGKDGYWYTVLVGRKAAKAAKVAAKVKAKTAVKRQPAKAETDDDDDEEE